MTDDVVARAEAWVADDPDPAGRAEIGSLLAAGDLPGLAERMDGRLRFGTAGLRGPLRAGPTGMNTAVVRRAAGGLAAHLGAGRLVVVGYDARHGSAGFARDTAQVLTGAGLRVLVLPRPLPTPVLAYAARRLCADAGVMVTASHNPAADNGYKVYLPDVQVVPPADAQLEAAMTAVASVTALPLGDGGTILGEDVVDAYLDAVVAGSLVPDRGVTLATTPLHGVGGAVLAAALRRAGFPPAHVVPAQAEPDPGFPTAPFPNPEEPGVLDAVLALAAGTGARLALANDPDADRLAAAEDGRVLTGDEVGILLADHVLAHRPGLVATSIVSSRQLSRLAAARAVPYAETLTGFKWLARAGAGLVFAYEEALGYAVAPDLVRDKDGISAALLLAERAAELYAAGGSLAGRLDELARETGLHVTAAVSVRGRDTAALSATTARLRSDPPLALGGHAVTAVTDLADEGGPLPPTDAVVLDLDAPGGNVRVVVRPSGTEPKLKAYLEWSGAAAADLEAQRQAARRQLDDIGLALRAALEPE